MEEMLSVPVETPVFPTPEVIPQLTDSQKITLLRMQRALLQTQNQITMLQQQTVALVNQLNDAITSMATDAGIDVTKYLLDMDSLEVKKR